MTSQWLSWINCLVAGVIASLLLATGLFWLMRPSEITCSKIGSKECLLPKNAFALPPESYKKVDAPFLALQQASPTILLPDLKAHLLYYGKNGRPDAGSGRTLIHFSLAGTKNLASVSPQEKLYLVYDKKTVPSHYIFSPGNAETSVWLEGTPSDTDVAIKLAMKNEKGEIITEPENCANFKLPEKEFIRYAGATWELNGTRVDGTLLARQKARWFGPDRFLEDHGGDEFAQMTNKQRIDFGENDEVYSIFASAGDCFIWNNGRWATTSPGADTLNYQLLVVKKADERLMTFELWDVEGKGKVVLNLLKSNEPWLVNSKMMGNIFKFVGARTLSQCVFEVNQERMHLKPTDWLIFTTKGWKKLESGQDIDDYVNRKISGTLFVFEGVKRKGSGQVMLGTLYNPTRSDSQPVEMAIQPLKKGKSASVTKVESKNNHDNDDDDEDDDDDDEEDAKTIPSNTKEMHPHPVQHSIHQPSKEKPVNQK